MGWGLCLQRGAGWARGRRDGLHRSPWAGQCAPGALWLMRLPCRPCRDHFIIFSGGMPRASYGDRHCVSVLRAETLVTLDFTSRIIDFFTVHSTRPEDGVCPPWPVLRALCPMPSATGLT